MVAHKAVRIAGDGIGPEVSRAAMKMLEAAGAPVSFEEHYTGVVALDRGERDVLPALR